MVGKYIVKRTALCTKAPEYGLKANDIYIFLKLEISFWFRFGENSVRNIYMLLEFRRQALYLQHMN